MYKTSLVFYIFRLSFSICLVGFMFLLYLTSVRLEDKVLKLRLFTDKMRQEMRMIKSKGVHKPVRPPKDPQKTDLTKSRPHIKEEYANLLTEDSFLTTKLHELVGENINPNGVFYDAVVKPPKNLHPFNSWNSVGNWNRACCGAVAISEFGKDATLAADMAIKIEARPREGMKDVSEFWVHLREGMFWEPLTPAMFSNNVKLAPHFLKRHPVTAQDFKFYFDAVANLFVDEAGAISRRNYFAEMDEIEVVDDLTFIVRWKPHFVWNEKGEVTYKLPYTAKLMTGQLRPLASFVYQYLPNGKKIIENDASSDTYRTNSLWAHHFMEHWASQIIPSCGPWLFEAMTDRGITFRKNPNYYNAWTILHEKKEIEFKSHSDFIWRDFKAGKIDSYVLRPEKLLAWEEFQKSTEYQRQIDEHKSIHSIDYLYQGYVYIAWNMEKPLFKSKKVRQAMTLAIDRRAIIQNIINGLGVECTGPFFILSDACDQSITPWPYDPQKAKQLLEEEGWHDSDNDGILDKIVDGKKIRFEFTLTYNVKSLSSQAICAFVSNSLKKIGIICHLNATSLVDLSAAFDDKYFDALSLAWALDPPPEEPRQYWHSAGAKEKGSSNLTGFANKEADQIIEKLQFEDQPDARQALYHRLHAIIHDEAPYTFLYIPKEVFLYRERLQNVFIPAERQDLIPGATVVKPQSNIFWLLDTKEL